MAKKKRYYKNKPVTAQKAKTTPNDGRYLTVLCTAAIAELFQLLVFRLLNGSGLHVMIATDHVLHIMAIVCPVLFVVSLILRLLLKKKQKLFNWLTVIFLFLSLSSVFSALWFTKGVKFVAVLVVFIAVLAFIYVIYQRAFFCSSVVIACGIGALTIYRRSAMWGQVSTRAWIVCIIAFVLLAAAALLLWRLKKAGGLWKIGEKERQLLPKKTDYRFLFLTLLIVALALVAAILLGSMAAYFAIFVLGVYFFVLAVYYTVKLV